MTDYQPIACSIHSEFEVAIMSRMPHTLIYLDSDDQKMTETINPLDLTTKEGEEFLVYQDELQVRKTIRLDRILSLNSIK